MLHAPRVPTPGNTAANTTDPAPPILQTPGLAQGCDSGQTNTGKNEPTRQSALIYIDESRDGIVNSDDGVEAHSYFQVIPPVPSLFTRFRPYLAHFPPVLCASSPPRRDGSNEPQLPKPRC